MIIIKTIPSFLEKSECDNMIKEYSNLKLEQAGYGDIDGNKKINKKQRDSNIIFIENSIIENKIINELKTHITIKGFDFIGLEKLQFTEYDINGHYDWHTDSDENNLNKRYYSIVVPLNADYTGGELICKNINKDDIILEKKTGNMHIFSSSLWHKVLPVLSGKRYSLVTWVSLEKNKNSKQSLI